MLIFIAMFILYGIQGAYQPAVQASIPALLPMEYIMQGNALINLVSSFSGLIGPVIGGTLFGFFGIMPILYISFICFIISAVMEIFIVIPFEKKEISGSIIKIGVGDLKESFKYMKNEQPLILTFSFAVAAINMLLSALMIIGLPVIVTKLLEFDAETANRLYGYAEGAMAIGSLCGGMSAGILAKKTKPANGYLLLFYDVLTLIPIGIAFMVNMPAFVSYIIIILSCFFMMLLASLFSIQIMSYLQIIVPGHLIGKVISCAMCIGMCATPVGQAIYGVLFERLEGSVYILFYIVTVLVVILSIMLKNPFLGLSKLIENKEEELNH